MLRIEEILPEVFLDDLASSVVQGESDPFTVRATGLSPTTSYGIRLSTDNGHLGFGVGCSAPGKSRFNLSGGASYSFAEVANGCDVGSGTVTATLLEGTTVVASATAVVDVEASSRVVLTLSPRAEGGVTHTDMTVSWTDPGGCEGSYFVHAVRSDGHLSKNYGFHAAPATTSISVDARVRWEVVSGSDLTVRVRCDRSGSQGWYVVGEAPLRSGLPGGE